MIILSIFLTTYTIVRLIRDSDFSEISKFIALTLCALALIQNITLLNIFGAFVTRYYKILAEIDVIFLINNIAMSAKSYKSLQQKDLYLLIYMIISVTIRQIFAMDMLDIDCLQSIALFITAFINCYVKFVFISSCLRISQRFLKLNDSITLLSKSKGIEKTLVQGKLNC